MIDLLAAYSVEQILIFTILLALAIKGVISFFDWAYSRIHAKFSSDHHLNENINKIDSLENKINNIALQVDLLIRSDRDSIKMAITKDYHYFCEQRKWIDDYSLECLERRYKNYQDEGGNSFIHNMMEEIRSLRRTPPPPSA